MEYLVDNSYKEAKERAEETAARRREAAVKKFKGDRIAAEKWLAEKNAQRGAYLAR